MPLLRYILPLLLSLLLSIPTTANASASQQIIDGGYIDMSKNLKRYIFYTHDYQGNVRVAEDMLGLYVERYDYYPYGALFGEKSPSQNYLYGGKEWERSYGMNHYDFHARWMNPLTTRFTTQDPLQLDFAELSSYSYCAGNPILYIDPTGKEIWINDIEYSIGMNYSGNNEFEKNTILALNTINNNGGDELIKDLVNSKSKYNYISTETEKSSTLKIDDNNYNIKISSSLNENPDAFFSAVAHESMHGIQYENGQGGNYIYNEVEAYVFEQAISINSFSNEDPNQFQSNGTSYNDTESGQLFDTSMHQLINTVYSENAMKQAVYNFKSGSGANNNGMYNKLKLYPNKQYKSMLNLYLKIIK